MAAALPEELEEQVLLRFPPDEPASLVRAALVSKRWCRLIAARRFRRQFRELHHRAAPLLGFVFNVFSTTIEADADDTYQPCNARLVPTSTCLAPRADCKNWQALDSRHGRVLLCSDLSLTPLASNPLDPFVIWNPVTGEQLELPSLPLRRCAPAPFSFNAMVLCAGGDACDHLGDDCHRGRFLVVFVGTYVDGLFTYMYSSDSGAWSEPTISDSRHDVVELMAAALVGNAVYFLFRMCKRLIKYDLGTRETTSKIRLPRTPYGRRILLMTTEKGKLGFTVLDDFKLSLWSVEVDTQGDTLWTQDRVIDLHNLLPADALLSTADVVGCVDGRGIVLVGTGQGWDDGLFKVDAKLNQAINLAEGLPYKRDDDVDLGYGHYFFSVLPYTGFYFPALGAFSTDEGPGTGEPSEEKLKLSV